MRNYKVIGKFFIDFLCKCIVILYKGIFGFVICGNCKLFLFDMDEIVIEKDMVNENDVVFDVIFSLMDILCVFFVI